MNYDITYPFGFSEAVVESIADEASKMDIPFHLGILANAEAEMYKHNTKPDPWLRSFINYYVFLREHSDALAKEMEALIQKAKEFGLPVNEAAAALYEYRSHLQAQE